ncbi:MAG: D-aminoacylase, partial [bacterium]|nr:D-aminoacylase [bacterium]
MRFLLTVLLTLPLLAADYDWLFRNARVIDGSGNPWFAADVAVADGKIAAVGNLINADDERVIDARERYLAPGF